ncbi:ATP-binding protein [Alkaliphilus peptidifermentans]|uniref:DNA replication protein DnaC n=1 Tax=Alkaliphilus peptidifermentans DSM 18978 TaxID=1120976 RepID=A0A1G5HDS6_9FIRM|nr:ATP-binding protein [Alkaliphilus peptidifermentans]SCY61857.1 DNA replication protein DnaC [Alkaliphilus peptidifermentans DSM 18978]
MIEEVINNILREYENKRNVAKKRKEQRRQEVYKKVPRIKEIDDSISKSGISIAKAIISQKDNPEELVNTLKQKLDKLKQEKAFLLTENNIPLQYLEEEYYCQYCNDTGFISSGEKCSCFKQQLINKAYSMSNLDNILQNENFKKFNISLFSDSPFEGQELSPRDNMMHILQVCEGFVINFEKRNEDNLLFFGPTGLGKTFLANCIAKALLDRGKIVIYQTAFKIFEILEDIRFHNQHDKEKYNLLFSADLLIIDDLGTEVTNSFTNSELFNIINSRLHSGKKSIISTNLTPKDFGLRYDDRIASRLFSKYTLLKFFGRDLRWQTE